MLKKSPLATTYRRQRTPGFTALIAALLVLCSTGLVGYAQGGYPPFRDPYVTDDADALTTKETNDLRLLLRTVQQDTGIEIKAMVIRSVSEYDTGDQSIESFATHLFNHWGIGDATDNDGVLILVATEDREVRIELGSGYGSAHNDQMAAVITEHMLPHFRRDDYGAGMVEGARGIIRALTGQWPADPRASRRTGTGVRLWMMGGGIAALVAAGFGLPKVLRRRKRRCAHCHTPMVRLDEASEDVYLDSGQKLEELLHSVDYDVWKCPACNAHAMVRYRTPSSIWKPCPKCGYLTFRTSRGTLVAATTTSTGQEQITQICHHCAFRSVHTLTLPRLVVSDEYGSSDDDDDWGSSEDSSSGGGQSSGDGASGSW